ncbi:guanine nucleotide binding protein, alpha subunit [Lentinula aciculospora]|uniref:Guanine nucleotide binding protein, alpha subunit n=1 Tax=Lentinula aciculospora TaxID=153920 RepID=A0A9W9AKM2_9AGAR|nr:guanine nucleotide binding protein, alpha subunit [Lentinula aciculospora]
MPRHSVTSEDEDPLTLAIAPPPNETPAERERRIVEEKKAREISDIIDEEINMQRLAEKRENPVKVLLLGQSESGKTTTLKNFQLINSPKAFKAERASWRAVIQLNVARSIRIIIDAMTKASSSSPESPGSLDDLSIPDSENELPTLTAEHLKLKMRLSPLLQVEESLWRRLSPSTAVNFETSLTSITNIPHFTQPAEVYVQSSMAWKSTFSRLVSTSTRRSGESDTDIDFDDPKDPGVILNNCAEDMIKLWHDPTIRDLLSALKIRLEDMPGFFLDDLERITALRYVPSDDDILKARLKTMGVSEHRFVLKTEGNMVSRDWRVFDVGGARSLRAAWAPFFEFIDAIIFLAPLSCFDQSLVEDPSVNRLEDSILLWRSIVSNRLLQKTELILFLNKCDILRAKLESGIQFSKWVISYGDRLNTFEGTSKYMKKKFGTIHKHNSPTARTFYCHFTSVTDIQSTFQILENVKDLIVRKSLSDSHML